MVDVEMEHVGRFAVGTVVGRWNQFDGDGRGVGAMLPYFLQEWQQLLFEGMEVLWVLWRAGRIRAGRRKSVTVGKNGGGGEQCGHACCQ